MLTNINEAATGSSNSTSDEASTNKGRGKGFKLCDQLRYVEQYRTQFVAINGTKAKKVTQAQYHGFIKATSQATMRLPLLQQVKSWDDNYDIIKLQVEEFGRGEMTNLLDATSGFVRNVVDKAVFKWLEEIRDRNLVVSGRDLKEAAKGVYTTLIDCCNPAGVNVDRRGRSFTASWRDAFGDMFEVRYCRLKGEAGSVNIAAIKERMAQLREICKAFTPENIYNADETGFYLQESAKWSYTTSSKTSGAKPDRGARVSVLFCVNATGTSLGQEIECKFLRPLVISKHIARDIKVDPTCPMEQKKTDSGWMTSAAFLQWLRDFDAGLKTKTLLIIDSCPAHANIDQSDPETHQPWKYLRIERLPPNSTSITQPLDAGIISVFKRKFLEMLGSGSIAKAYGGKKISNGEAWALIPYAWSHVKRSTVRHCFLVTKLLDMTAVRLERHAWGVEKSLVNANTTPIWPPELGQDQEQARAQYLRSIIMAMKGDVELEPDKEAEPDVLGEMAVRKFQLALQGVEEKKRAAQRKKEERARAYWARAADQKLFKELQLARRELSQRRLHEERLYELLKKRDDLLAEKEARDSELLLLIAGLKQLREEVDRLSEHTDGNEHIVALEAREETINVVKETRDSMARSIMMLNLRSQMDKYQSMLMKFHINTSHEEDVEAFKSASMAAPAVWDRTVEMLNDDNEEVRELTKSYIYRFNPKKPKL